MVLLMWFCCCGREIALDEGGDVRGEQARGPVAVAVPGGVQDTAVFGGLVLPAGDSAGGVDVAGRAARRPR